MAIIDSFYAALKQEGYAPRIGEGGVISFKYFGQECAFHLRALGIQAIAELECRLPRPAPTPEAAQSFAETHTLARLGSENDRSVLFLVSLIGEREALAQIALMLELLGLYTSDLMFGTGSAARGATVFPEPVAATRAEPPPAMVMAPVSEKPAEPANSVPELPGLESAGAKPQKLSSSDSANASLSGAGPAPTGWEDFWPLMNVRYHPLAQALARLGVPVPSDVQVDMMQGHQVRGTAIMLWHSLPESVVICEPGQMVPDGYLGGTWLRHFTVEQVAASIQHNLRKVGLL